jgi:hypothetical protein
MPEVIFLNNIQLSKFEYAYKSWIELLSTPEPEDQEEMDKLLVKRNEALQKLLSAMIFIPPPPVT